MGHWEQIAVENQRYREKRARMNPRVRAIQDFTVNAVVIVLSILIWAGIIRAIVRPFL